MNPRQNSAAVVNRILAPYSVPIQSSVVMAAGIVMIRVGTENTVAENGFIPLMNM
jgi:hypothetical protein